MVITKIMKATLFVSIFFLFVNISPANALEILPKIIKSGFAEYKSFGSKKAVLAWMVNGPLEGSSESTALMDDLQQIDKLYGSYKNYELIKTVALSKSTNVVYIAINYDLGPLFAKFIIYDTGGEWVVTRLDVNTKPETIMPGLDLWLTNREKWVNIGDFEKNRV